MAMTGGTDYLVKSEVTNYGSGPDTTKLYLRVKEYSQSVANNQTVLKVGMWVTSQYEIGTWPDGNGSYVGTATSGTDCHTFDGTINYGSGVRWLTEDQTFTVTHNNDGTKTARIYWKLGVNSPWGQYVYPSGYIDVPLTRIARASQPTLSKTTANFGEQITIYSNTASSTFKHKVYYRIGSGAWGQIIDEDPDAGSEGKYFTNSCLWTIPKTLINNFPNSRTGNLEIGLYTYTDSTFSNFIGTKSVMLKAIVPVDNTTKPSASLSVTLNNGSLPTTFNGCYIQGKSKVDVTLSGTGKYNASIKGYRTILDSTQYNSPSFTSNAIQSYGSLDIVGEVKDSRNIYQVITKSIVVIPYSKPLVIPIPTENAIMCYRSDADGNKVSNSTSVWIKARRSYYTVTLEGTQKNFCSLQWRSKASGGSWTEWVNLIERTNLLTDQYDAIIPNVVFDLKKSYTIEIKAVDDIGESDTKTFEIPTQDVAIHMGKGGNIISIGQYCDYSIPDSFQVHLDTYLKGETGLVKFDYIVEQGTSSGWGYRKWSSGRLEQWKIISPTFTSWDTFGNAYWYTSNRVEFTFGIPFIEQPVINATINAANFAASWAIPLVDSVSTTTFSIISVRPNEGATSANIYYYSIYAIGKWK